MMCCRSYTNCYSKSYRSDNRNQYKMEMLIWIATDRTQTVDGELQGTESLKEEQEEKKCIAGGRSRIFQL